MEVRTPALGPHQQSFASLGCALGPDRGLPSFAGAPLPVPRDTSDELVWPSGLALYDRFLSESQHDELLAAVDSETWDTRSLQRRVQQYGVPYDYRQRELAVGRPPRGFPRWLSDAAAAVAAAAGVARFDQAIVNEYLPGQGIGLHSDHPDFGPLVASLSLGSAVDMEFWSRKGDVCAARLFPRTMMLLSGPARASWRHGIVPRHSDPYRGAHVRRQRRVSITLRTVPGS